MKKSLLFLIAIVVGYSAFAQDYIFRVMLNKGENKVGIEGKWDKLVTGSKLGKGQIIKVGDEGYVALVHSTGATVELKEAGEYKVDELDKKIAGGQASLLQKYTQYIMNNISDDNHQRLNATGAVTRSIIDVKVYMMGYSEYFGKEQIFDWEDIDGVQSYVVTLKDKFDDELMKKEVDKSEVMFDFSDPKLKNEELVSVFIAPKGEIAGNDDGFGLKPLEDDDLMKIKNEYGDLTKEVDQESALGHLVLAAFFEENNLYSDAVTHYKKAIALSPGVEDYKKMYNLFLERAGLKEKTAN